MTMHRILIANDEDNIVVNIVYRETSSGPIRGIAVEAYLT